MTAIHLTHHCPVHPEWKHTVDTSGRHTLIRCYGLIRHDTGGRQKIGWFGRWKPVYTWTRCPWFRWTPKPERDGTRASQLSAR